MDWFCLFLAGGIEIAGTAALNQFQRTRSWLMIMALVICFSTSFSLLSYAMNTISMGTSYAVWTGIGTVGSALVGMLFFRESKDWRRLVYMSMVIASAIGLKLFS
ncbi:DMT family transporter [Paenibacillus sp. y28]|uniref:DMT family transporter n=1 Tax=Paenibacillus sp. y28 TaxID=3129110 RepID=UPI00301AF523